MIDSARLPRSIRVLVAPRAVFAEVLATGKGYGALLGFLFIELLLVQPEAAAPHFAVATADPIGGLAGLWSLYVSFALKPAITVFAVGALVYFNQRRTRQPIEIWTAASLFAYAWVPHLLLVALSAALAATGADHPIMPHRPFAELGGGMALLKVAIEHGTTLALGILALQTLRRRSDTPSPASADPKRALIALAGALLLIIVGLGATGFRVSTQWESIRPVMPDDPVPAFVVRALDGKSFQRDSDLTGKVTLIDFWATWCPPCVEAMPGLSGLYQRLNPQGMELLSVNVEPNNPEAVRAFARKHRLPFDVYVDSGLMQQKLRVRTFPTLFVVDKAGVVRHVHIGASSISNLEKEIQALLKEAAPEPSPAPPSPPAG